MKSYFKYIVIYFLISNITIAYAVENFSQHEVLTDIEVSEKTEDSEKKVGGKIIFDLEEFEEETKRYTPTEKLEILLQKAKDFGQIIEGDKLDENFTEELARFFPDDNTADLYNKQKNIRTAVRLFRYFKSIYEDIKAKMLVPPPPPLIVDDKDYDMGYHEEYIEAPKGEFVVVEDFKKVLSYGSDPRDQDAMDAKIKRDIEEKRNKTRFEQLLSTMSKVSWKKALFDDDFTYSPLTGEDGSGPWEVIDNKVMVRIITTGSRIGDNDSLKMVLDFIVAKNHYIKASMLQDNPYIKIDFSNSINYKDSKIFYLAPSRFDIGEDKREMAYGSRFAIPFIVSVEDRNQDLQIYANIKATLCDINLECKDIEINPFMLLEAGEELTSQYAVYVNKVFSNIPNSNYDSLRISSLTVSKDKSGKEYLRAIIKSGYDISFINLFVESVDGIGLERPRVSIDSNKVIARIYPKNSDVELKGKDFIITAVANKIFSIRDTITANEDSILDIMGEKLSIPLILLAILGGFILNFMPCVFPVLSIKLLSLNNIGARKMEEIRKSFYLTIAGIIITFFILSFILCLIKYLGHSIGWGMQFQSPVFLVCMIFIIALFIAYILRIQTFKTPEWLNKLIFKSRDENSIIYFMTGVLVVIMATPCTAPYLGTTIGFALAGSYSDIIIILMSISLGLSLPYLFFAVFPHLAVYVPKPGSWMEKLNLFMVIMLIMTFFWLVSIYYVQTTFWAAFRVVLYILLLLLVLWVRYYVMIEIETTTDEKEMRKKLKRKFSNIALFISLSLFSIAIFDGSYNFNRRYEEVLQSRSQRINMEQIKEYIYDGKVVLVNVQADWCLTCKYNDFMVLSNVFVERLIEKNELVVINVDWTNYDEQVLEFMEKYGRKGLPFYILYSRNVPDGMVLPEILNEIEFMAIVENIRG